ncbi:MAG: isoleucine--tRNA ligase [Christensenellales bacterium]|jgi:isoleucyl-tRNA synthetase
MYKKVTTSLDFVPRENEILEFWRENDIFKKSVELRKGCPTFTFYDGPPTANGKPHIGHILTRCVKDIIPRYKHMKGYDVLRKAGWDTHGLPVELEVEKQLGLDGKPQIEAYGVEPFIKECKKSVWKYKEEWERMSERVGFWADMENPYITYENDYIESVWWSIKEISKKGLLYKGHKVVPYCPRCGTALSSHEVAQGYQDVTDISAYVKFALKDGGYIMAWTTTPWTLPSNVALCVHPNEKYVRVRYHGQEIIMAKALVETVCGCCAEIVAEYTGKELEGLEYQPLFDFQSADKKAWFVCNDKYVTLNDGTGVVHIAPAFGEDDARIGKNYDLPFVQLVNEQGNFEGGTPWDGSFCKDADPAILDALEENGNLYKKAPYEHSYPYCWRCDTPLLYYARSTWFIKMTAVKEQLMKNNRSVNWLPGNIKEGRMGHFLENVIDWGLSRERYWGTPLPVWECECGHVHVIGSVNELKEMGGDVPEDLELHKPYIDRISIKCDECGGDMQRVSEVIDCWYDSGSMPFAQWHYPFENTDIFEKRFPADFISEAIDQTRGWFYTLLAISTCIFGKSPFDNCIVLGHVQDKEGKKMSKHLGNVVDPWSVLDEQGADAVRWFFYTGSAPWLPVRFHAEAVSEAQRKFMGTLWNTYYFYVLYADIDSFDPTKHSFSDDLNVMDRWALSRLNSLIKAVSDDIDAYRIIEAGREIQRFVDDISNWYVRRSRERFWAKGMDKDKTDAFMTLYTVLETLSRLIAPFTPFIAEQIYQNIKRTVDKDAALSVHLCDYPVADDSFIDNELEKNMDTVLTVVTLGRAARNTAAIKNRQPLQKMYLQGAGKMDEIYLDVIMDELNVKTIDAVDDTSGFMTYSIKPQLKTVGPKYGKLLPAIRTYLAACDGNAVVEGFAKGQPLVFEANGSKVELEEADTIIEPVKVEGYAMEKEGSIAVVLDTRVTPELIEEGYVRELTSKVQTMRKDAGFEVTDHIVLYHDGGGELTGVIERHADTMSKALLADAIKRGLSSGYSKQWDINGHSITLGVEKMN